MSDWDEGKRDQRIRERAYRLWEEEGRPEGRADIHWDKAAELVAIEDNHEFALQPVNESVARLGPEGEPVEPIEALSNEGEFPTTTDQGEQSIPARPAAKKRQSGRKPR